MKRKRRKRKLPLNAEQIFAREQRKFRASIRRVFEKAGFVFIPTKGKEIIFHSRTSEFDAIFTHENIIVVAEETCHSTEEKTRAHLLKKEDFHNHLRRYDSEVLPFLAKEFPELKATLNSYSLAECRVIFVYCSKRRIDEEYKAGHHNVRFMEDRDVQYFSSMARTIGRTMHFELLKFLELQSDDIGHQQGSASALYAGFVLPETPSGFPAGFKIVTFYVDPDTLMRISYVLRKDGWEGGGGLYQRMISRSKIRNMRRFLAVDERVFINNVIVSLPSDTRVTDTAGKHIDLQNVTKTTPARVQIPFRFNSVGLIDGQHRVFAYHEGSDSHEPTIASKRKRQQLLVTGVVYPNGVSAEKQREFEAKLFLEINDKQTRTKADLRQAIESIVNPYSVVAIAKAVITELARKGPLCGIIEEHQFERGKLKSSSIVSYGLRHIVKCEEGDTLFSLWKHSEKQTLADAVKSATLGKRDFQKPSPGTLENYVRFCAAELNILLGGFRHAIPKELWTLDRKQSRALSTTSINGLIFCMRVLLSGRTLPDHAAYAKAFSKLSISYLPGRFRYKSSHWKDLGLEISETCFGMKAPS